MEMYRTDQVYSNTFYNVSYNIDSHTAIVHVYHAVNLAESWSTKPSDLLASFGVWIGPCSDAATINFYKAWCAIKPIAI